MHRTRVLLFVFRDWPHEVVNIRCLLHYGTKLVLPNIDAFNSQNTPNTSTNPMAFLLIYCLKVLEKMRENNCRVLLVLGLSGGRCGNTRVLSYCWITYLFAFWWTWYTEKAKSQKILSGRFTESTQCTTWKAYAIHACYTLHSPSGLTKMARHEAKTGENIGFSTYKMM